KPDRVIRPGKEWLLGRCHVGVPPARSVVARSSDILTSPFRLAFHDPVETLRPPMVGHHLVLEAVEDLMRHHDVDAGLTRALDRRRRVDTARQVRPKETVRPGVAERVARVRVLFWRWIAVPEEDV